MVTLKKEVFMKKYLFIVVSLLVIFAGCSKTSDSQEITDIITTDFSDWFGSSPYTGQEEGDTLAPSGTKAYKWVFWYREDTLNAAPEISVDITGDSAYVSWNRNIDGIFHRFPVDTLPPPPRDSLQDIPKHLQDTVMRYGVFKKDGDPNRHHGWRLKRLTGALIDSPNHTVSIDSVKITTNTDTVLITDPLAFRDTTNVLSLSCNDSVNVTVYVDPSKSVLVFLHSRRGTRHHRWMFHLESPGVFTGWWKAPRHTGRHLAAVDVIEYNAIFDDDETTYPYDAEAWIIPYRTK